VYELASPELQPIGRPHVRRKINLEKVKNFQQRKSDAQEPRFSPQFVHKKPSKNHVLRTRICEIPFKNTISPHRKKSSG
jgi:hypothetical protein